MLGLGSSLVHPDAISGDLEWSASKYLYLPGDTGDYTRVQSFSNFLNRISDGGTDDIADNITISFWVKPIWVMGTDITSDQWVVSGGGTQNQVPLFSFGNTSTERDRIRIVYTLDNAGNSDKNRLNIQAVDANANKEQDEVFLHASNNSTTGLGASLESHSVGAGDGWWNVDNKGNVNSDDFVHLCFTRASGNWTIYWNGSALGNSIDADSGTLDFDEGNVDEFWLGRSFINQDDVKIGLRDIACFNAKLSGSEVTELYNSGDFFDVRTHSKVDDLGLYWPCQDAQEFSGAGSGANLDLRGNSQFASME
jgi:hypothetical protein